ncbi:OmpA family protein [Niveibacterium microcysteis]|uniref:OmpA family protein n=1 Tax=Niveibacterium microcysteis TaxID=2811415 RepID=A0ABX7M7P6_9RHOO|nr:OmpA family protein [Niveibacterium microcysteis]
MSALRMRIAALGILALAGTAHAQEAYNPSWYALPSVTTLDSDKDWKSDDMKVGGGLAFGGPLSQAFDLQIGGYGNRTTNPNSYRQNILGADVLWLFSRSSFRPFVLAGGGIEDDKLGSETGTYSKNAAYLNGGAGFQWFWGEQFFLQADARYIYGFTNKDKWGENLDSSGNIMYRVGLGWVFSPPPKPAAPVTVARAEAPKPTAPAPVAPKPSAEKVTLAADALFDFDKAVLREDGKAKLAEFAAATKQLSTLEVITAVGYTDRLGKDAYNQTLSEQRAAAVKNFLVEQGIDPNRVATEGKGKANPIAPCTGLGAESNRNKVLVECLQTNRRVEVEVIGTRMPQ